MGARWWGGWEGWEGWERVPGWVGVGGGMERGKREEGGMAGR